MYFQLTGAVKDRFILELRRYWQYHPKYRDIVESIQGKYSFKERPSFGIVCKTGSANRVDLSADNYVGIVESYTYLTKFKNYPGVAIEWVREDSRAIQENGGLFPSPPGVYYIELTENTEFFVDPLYDVYREMVTQVDPQRAQLKFNPLAGTLHLYDMPSGFLLQEGSNYTVSASGLITLASPLKPGRYLSADYRYPGESKGPFQIYENRAINSVIPGVVLAFGRRNEKGDRMAVVVQDIRRPAALEYGGRWELTLDFDVIARDVMAQQEIADQTVIYIWGILRNRLSTEGLEITECSMGGESEEVYDENGDDYFYNSSFSVTVQTDWSVHVPLDRFIRHVAPLTLEETKEIAGLSDEEVTSRQNDIKMLESLGLDSVVDPFFSGKTSTYEIIR